MPSILFILLSVNYDSRYLQIFYVFFLKTIDETGLSLHDCYDKAFG